MITGIRIRDFKNFQDAYLTVGKFTVVVGTNASGKSNIRDVFRFLHGIGRGYSLAEIIGGRYGAGGQAEWAQMRGAASEIIRFGQTRFQIDVGFGFNQSPGQYHIAVERSDQGWVASTRPIGWRPSWFLPNPTPLPPHSEGPCHS